MTKEQTIIVNELEKFIGIRKAMRAIKIIDEMLPGIVPEDPKRRLTEDLAESWNKLVIHILNILVDMPYADTHIFGHNTGLFIQNKEYRIKVLNDLEENGKLADPLGSFIESLEDPSEYKVQVVPNSSQPSEYSGEDEVFKLLDDTATAYNANKYMIITEALIHKSVPDAKERTTEDIKEIKEALDTYLREKTSQVMGTAEMLQESSFVRNLLQAQKNAGKLYSAFIPDLAESNKSAKEYIEQIQKGIIKEGDLM